MKLNILGLVLKLIVMSINILIHNFKILAQRPVINRLKPIKTETGLKTAKNCGLFCGLVWSFDFWGKGRLVMVTVKALWHQKTGPDFQTLVAALVLLS